MWEIVSNGGLEHRWPTPSSWNRGEGKEEKEEEEEEEEHINIYICN